MCLKGFHIAPSGILVNGSILEKLLSNDAAVYEADRRDKFHVNLDTLAGVVHLLIGFWDIPGVRGMYSHDTLFFEEAVQSRDGA